MSKKAFEVNKFYHDDDVKPTGFCHVCDKEIKVSIFKDKPWCSEQHRQVFVGEINAWLRP